MRLNLSALCRTVAKYSSLPLDHVSRDDVCTLLSRIKSNSLHIVMDDGDTLGMGVYPFCSMINHSDKYDRLPCMCQLVAVVLSTRD